MSAQDRWRSPPESLGSRWTLQADLTKEHSPLARRIMARYYPGFFAAFFLVLLRIAIGWHFLTRGREDRVDPAGQGAVHGRDLPAERHRAARPLFPRAACPTSNGLRHARPDRLKAAWAADVERIADHYGFDRGPAGQGRRSCSRRPSDSPTSGSATPRTPRSGRKYFDDLARSADRATTPMRCRTSASGPAERTKDLDADRRPLIAPLARAAKALRDAVTKLATPEQVSRQGRVAGESAGLPAPTARRSQAEDRRPGPARPDQRRDHVRPGRDRALPDPRASDPAGRPGRAVFLAMIYLSMPPWPGLPPTRGPRAITSS